MAIAIALLGFNDLGRSVTPTFLFTDFLDPVFFIFTPFFMPKLDC